MVVRLSLSGYNEASGASSMDPYPDPDVNLDSHIGVSLNRWLNQVGAAWFRRKLSSNQLLTKFGRQDLEYIQRKI